MYQVCVFVKWYIIYLKRFYVINTNIINLYLDYSLTCHSAQDQIRPRYKSVSLKDLSDPDAPCRNTYITLQILRVISGKDKSGKQVGNYSFYNKKGDKKQGGLCYNRLFLLRDMTDGEFIFVYL